MKNNRLKKGTVKKGLATTGNLKKKIDPRKNYSDLLALISIIVLGIIIYSDSFTCSFHFDDLHHIVDNPKIQHLSDLKAIWNYIPNRPFPILSLAINYYFGGTDVWGYHLVNLIIHLANACLVYWLTLLIFSTPYLKDQRISRYKKELAFIIALLFMSHPLATQSVTYIIQRMNSMVTLFYLLSLILYVEARLSELKNSMKALLFAGSFISAVVAMLSKENGFTLPFAILLVEFFFIRTRKLTINFKDYRVILLVAAFLAVVLIIPLKSSLSIFDPIPPTLGHTYFLTPVNYLLTQFSVVVKYIQLLFIPAHLHLDYDFPVSNNFFEIRTLLSFLLLSSLVFLAIFLFNRHRIISFGIAWFFLTLSIESSVIPITDVIFEHRTYLPSFGFFLVIVPGVYGLFREKYKLLPMAVFAVIIGINSYLTYERNKVWEDDLTLWTDNIEKAPGFARPYSNRGYTYIMLGQYEKSIPDFTRAIEINPNFVDPYSNRGNAYGRLKLYDKAVEDCSKAIKIDPKYAAAYFNRATAYGFLKEFDKAIADYNTAIGIDSSYAWAYFNRGNMYGALERYDLAIADFTKAIQLKPDLLEAYTNRSAAYANLNQSDKAVADMDNTIGLKPDDATVFYKRANIFENSQQWEKAIADYKRAVEIDPGMTDAYYNLGVAYGNLNQWEKAIDNYSKAIDQRPDYTYAYYNRGIAYGTFQQWRKAIDDYTRAIGIDPKYTKAYFNRGIAFASLKEWTRAVADYSRAIELNPAYKEAYVNRGAIYGTLGQWSKAVDDYNSALRIDPNFSIAKINLENALRNVNNQ